MWHIYIYFRTQAWLLQKWLWASGLAFLPFFSWSNHLVCRPKCILYNQKCVSFSSESLWLPNTTQMAVWKTESPNRNRECRNVSLRHLPETCWCIMCWKIGGNSNFMGGEKCCLYKEFLNFFGLSIKNSSVFLPSPVSSPTWLILPIILMTLGKSLLIYFASI